MTAALRAYGMLSYGDPREEKWSSLSKIREEGMFGGQTKTFYFTVSKTNLDFKSG